MSRIDISIGMALQFLGVRNGDPAQDDSIALLKRMDIKPAAGAHIGLGGHEILLKGNLDVGFIAGHQLNGFPRHLKNRRIIG